MLPRVLEPEVMDTWEDAVEYDSMDFTEVNTAFAERALELAPPSGMILDVGTGSGRIPILILQRRPDFDVIAIDLSENMLKVGQQNVHRARMEEKIVFRLLDAKNLPFPDGSFDMVISNSLAHHLPDPLPFFQEVHRVLKTGAGLL
ncbi:MAG: class I SAM-dependent methyltransferase, partial [Bacteroidota bacterium]